MVAAETHNEFCFFDVGCGREADQRPLRLAQGNLSVAANRRGREGLDDTLANSAFVKPYLLRSR